MPSTSTPPKGNALPLRFGEGAKRNVKSEREDELDSDREPLLDALHPHPLNPLRDPLRSLLLLLLRLHGGRQELQHRGELRVDSLTRGLLPKGSAKLAERALLAELTELGHLSLPLQLCLLHDLGDDRRDRVCDHVSDVPNVLLTILLTSAELLSAAGQDTTQCAELTEDISGVTHW
jgi:hypothetical protein